MNGDLVDRGRLDAFLNDIKINKPEREQITLVCTPEQYDALTAFYRLMTPFDAQQIYGYDHPAKVLTREQVLELRIFVYRLFDLLPDERLYVRDPSDG